MYGASQYDSSYGMEYNIESSPSTVSFSIYVLSAPIPLNSNPTPEPSSLIIWGSALLGFAGVSYLRRRRAKA